MTVTVRHQSLANNWLSPAQIENPRTLVLGSFNPFNERGNGIVDYYYGREKNHFWRRVAEIRNLPQDYFFRNNSVTAEDTALNRKVEIMRNRFCCLDVIDSINFESEVEDSLNDYLNRNIYANYLDQNIWVSKTKVEKLNEVRLFRSYNYSILTVLESFPSIEKVIHTMGSNRISPLAISPQEKGLGDRGFSALMKSIIDLCNRTGRTFIYHSLSPSDYAVKTGKTSLAELDSFLREHLWLNEH